MRRNSAQNRRSVLPGITHHNVTIKSQHIVSVERRDRASVPAAGLLGAPTAGQSEDTARRRASPRRRSCPGRSRPGRIGGTAAGRASPRAGRTSPSPGRAPACACRRRGTGGQVRRGSAGGDAAAAARRRTPRRRRRGWPASGGGDMTLSDGWLSGLPAGEGDESVETLLVEAG